MSYLLAQILVCLLIAGLIGAVIGWLLRGDCKKVLENCEEEWKMRVGAMESEYNSKLNSSNSGDEQAILKSDTSTKNERASLLSDDLIETKKRLNLDLDDHKLALYSKCDLNLNDTKYLEDKYDLLSIEDIEPFEYNKLKEAGIKSTKELATLQGNLHTISKLSQKIGVDEDSLSNWASVANLLQLPGVDPKAATLLSKIGISSIKELSHANPDTIYKEVVNFNEKVKLLDEVPSQKMISIWTKISKHLS